MVPGFNTFTRLIADKLGVPRYAVIGGISAVFASKDALSSIHYPVDHWLKFAFFTGLAMALCAFVDRRR